MFTCWCRLFLLHSVERAHFCIARAHLKVKLNTAKCVRIKMNKIHYKTLLLSLKTILKNSKEAPIDKLHHTASELKQTTLVCSSQGIFTSKRQSCGTVKDFSNLSSINCSITEQLLAWKKKDLEFVPYFLVSI